MRLPKFVPRLSQLQPRERLLAIGCTIVLLVVAMDRLVLGPWLRHVRTMQEDTGRLEEALRRHDRLLARREHVVAELQQAQRYLHVAIADDLQTAALIKDIEELAVGSHVTLGEVKPLGVESTETEKRYALDVRFECTLEEWVDFVYRLETSPSLYDVVRAGLAVDEEQRDRLEGTLRVQSVAMRPEGASSAPADGGGAL